MFCSNCGHELKENEMFCPECGAPNASSTQTNNQQTTYEYNNETAASDATSQPMPPHAFPEMAPNMMAPLVPEEAKPKKKKLKKILIAIFAVLLIGGGSTIGILAATGHLSSMFHKAFSSPEEYFQYVAEKNVDSRLDSVNSGYATYMEKLKETSFSESITFDIELGKSFQDMLALASPELSKLKKASFKTTLQSDAQKTNMQMKTRLNDADLATINAYIDLGNSEGYLQIPELSDAYLDFSELFADVRDELNETTKTYNELVTEMDAVMPEADAVNNILKRYSTIILENADDVEKSSDTLEAGGVEQKCTTLTTKLDGKYLYHTIEQLLSTIIEDEDLEEIIKNLGPDVYDDFVHEVERYLDRFKSSKEEVISSDINLKLKYYVDSKDQIVGQELKGSIEGKELKIVSYMPKDGDDFGYTFSVKVEDTQIFSLDGNGTITKDILNGDFSLSLDSSLNPDSDYVTNTKDILEFKLSDWDLTAMEEGTLNGSIEISSKAIPIIKDYSMELTAKSSNNHSSFSIKVKEKGTAMLTATISSDQGEKLSDFKPSSSDKVYDITNDSAMNTYIQEMDLEKFVEDLSNTIGIDVEDIEDLLEDVLGSSNTNWNDDADDDYWDDDDLWNDEDDDYWDDDDLWDTDNDDPWDDNQSNNNSSNQTYNTIQDFVNSSELQSQVDGLKSSVEAQGMSFDIKGEGNKLIYSYRLTNVSKAEADTAGMATKLRDGLNAQASIFKSVASNLKQTVNVDNPICVVEYLASGGEVIYSQEFTAN